jgi:hypothetical protein
MNHTVRLICSMAAALALTSFAAGAQVRSPLAIDQQHPRAAIAVVNPIGILAGALNVDVEARLSGGFSGAVAVTHWPGEDYTSFDATGRYYPAELTPAGFSVGLSLGHVNMDRGTADETRGPTIGFIVGYNWILGRTDRLAIALGAGAKRVFAKDVPNANPQEVIPTGRFGLGIAF